MRPKPFGGDDGGSVGGRREASAEKRAKEISFDAPDRAGTKHDIDAAYVRERLADVSQDEDLARFIL